MATPGPTPSNIPFLYVEMLQLHAGRINKLLVWLESESGPSHDKVFTTCAKIGDEIYPKAQDKTKKKAKQNAAKRACEVLNLHGMSELSFDRISRPLSPAGIENCISKLNEYGQKKNLNIAYIVNQINTGLAHIQRFSCHFVIDDKKYPEAFGGSKQDAKRNAAKLAYEEIQDLQSSLKNLEKLPEDVSSQKETNGTTEESSAENPERLTEDQEKRDLLIDSNKPGNSEEFSCTRSANSSKNIVGNLYEICQKKKLLCSFQQVDKRGPSHVPEFTLQCVINGKVFPSATGCTKQEAKQRAAELALKQLETSSDLSWASGFILNSDSQDENLSKEGVRHCYTSDSNSSESSTPSTMSTTGSKGKSLADFEDLHEIAEGGFGKVYKAKKTLDDEYYAIKEVLYQDDTLREVKSLAQMDHHNIVRYHTCWLENSLCKGSETSLFIQMKLYQMNLRDWIEDPQNNQPQQKQISLDIMHQLLDGVHYIHQKKMVHRDLKPANIFLSEEGKLEAKIGDFGLVRVYNQKSLTSNVGTHGYMSPEQRRGEDYDHKVDIFALGLIFFDLLWIYYGSATEKIKTWEHIRKGFFTKKFVDEHSIESILIRKMLSETASERPEAAEVKRKLDSSDVQTI